MSDEIKNDNDYVLTWNDATHQYDKRPKRTDELQWPYGAKCECGVASLGYSVGHSDYCPLYRTGGAA